MVMKSFERLVLAYLKASTGPLLDCLQFAYRENRYVDDAVNMGLNFILQHLDRPKAPLLTPSSRTPFRINWHSSLSPPPSVSGSPASCQTGSHSAPVQSALELLRAVFSPHCSSPCTRMTAHLKTPPSSSWSLQTTPHWSASSRMVTSLLTDRRLRSWLSGAVLTTWSITRLKQWRWSWTSGDPPHHHEQHCDCSGVIQIPGQHNFSGPEVGQSH